MVWILGFQLYLAGSMFNSSQGVVILVGTVMVLATFGFVAWTIRLVVFEIRDQKQASEKAESAENSQTTADAPRQRSSVSPLHDLTGEEEEGNFSGVSPLHDLTGEEEEGKSSARADDPRDTAPVAAKTEVTVDESARTFASRSLSPREAKKLQSAPARYVDPPPPPPGSSTRPHSSQTV